MTPSDSSHGDELQSRGSGAKKDLRTSGMPREPVRGDGETPPSVPPPQPNDPERGDGKKRASIPPPVTTDPERGGRVDTRSSNVREYSDKSRDGEGRSGTPPPQTGGGD